MANNYRQFSFALKLANKKEAAWCQKTLKKLSETDDGEGGETTTDYDWSVYPTKEEPKALPHIWFRDNGEYGNVEQIANFVEKYLKKFQPNGYFTMTWSDTCSKHRIGEFGGGLAVVKARETHWFQDHQWIDELTKTLTSRNTP
jgi:hypothetical protein